jgi:hypothetical protein
MGGDGKVVAGDGKVFDVVRCAFQCFQMLSNAFPMKSMLQKTSKTLGGRLTKKLL